MTRFEILAALARAGRWVTIIDVRNLAGERSKSALDSLRVQLSRLHYYGLVYRRWSRWTRYQGIAFGAYLYRLAPRGRDRLRWVRETGHLD